MSRYEQIKEELKRSPKIWLVTGVAGFIGSNILETLLLLDQTVVGLDNFSTGFKHNLDEVKGLVTPEQWSRFRFVEGDICDLETCRTVTTGVDFVLHQAALGSVPRSIEDPIRSNKNNIDGFLNMLLAAKDHRVKSFVYAASSSTYGDHEALPKIEDQIGNPLSPYAVTKYVNELYAQVFSRCYDFPSIGLRYFNVFGPRQNPDGAYAAVIPKWIAKLSKGESVQINGDGETSRDFCYVSNAVQANLLAVMAPEKARGQVYNVAVGDRTSLNELFSLICDSISKLGSAYVVNDPQKLRMQSSFRSGDVRHSQACVDKAITNLGYLPSVRVDEGIRMTISHFIRL